MNKLMIAVAMSIALPAVAHAQAAPAPAPEKMACCEKMKEKQADGTEKKCDCCKDMDHKKMDHSKHDMKGGADAHAGHGTPADGATPKADAPHQH